MGDQRFAKLIANKILFLEEELKRQIEFIFGSCYQLLSFNLTCNLDFLHNFIGLILHFNFNRDGITMVVDLFSKRKRHWVGKCKQ